MDQIIQFHEEDMDIVVQPSVSWMELNEELSRRQSGLFFPVDPGPSVSINYLFLLPKDRTLTVDLVWTGQDRWNGWH
jgi:FAD/FMN-containing dehydrogenase